METIIAASIYFVCLIVIFIYSSIAVKQAARFRLLSPRTVSLTLFYIAGATVLTVIGIITFFNIDWGSL